MNEYIEFLRIIDALKTCITHKPVPLLDDAYEILETAKELYNLKIDTFEELEGKD
jgi:hypothetical protein